MLSVIWSEHKGSWCRADVIYPLDSGVINVKTAYGAKGDGITDDTIAIQAAIRDHLGNSETIYFPEGTYLVSDTLMYVDNNGNWRAYLTLQGQNQTNTIIKLVNSALTFQDPTHPKAVIYTASNAGSSLPTAPNYNPGGGGNEGFRNHIKNLTVEIGSNNRGAIAIDYMANNNTRISDVKLISDDGSGVYGLNIQRGYPGPMLLKNLTIIGFSTGMYIASSYGVWIEHLILSGQSTSGVDVGFGSLSIRDIQSSNSVPAIRAPYWSAVISVVDAQLTGGSLASSAIQLGGPRPPTAFVRNAISSGYQSLISLEGSPVQGTSVSEWTSVPPTSLFQSAAPKSLNLSVAETPTYDNTDLTQWKSVTSFGAVPYFPGQSAPGIDSTAAIQAAIDSGAATVYFPFGNYLISNTIHLRGAVQRLLGLGGVLIPFNSQAPGNAPALQIDDTLADTVFIDSLLIEVNFWTSGQPGWTEQNVINNSSRTVVLENIDYIGYVNTPASAGTRVFLENVFGNSGMSFVNQTVFARNLDPENWNQTAHVHVSGGSLWSLGLKTEGSLSSVLVNDSGASTEILGAAVAVWGIIPSSIPMVSNQDSSLSMAAFRGNPGPDTDYEVLIHEQAGSVSAECFRSFSGLAPSPSQPYGLGSAGSLFADEPLKPQTITFTPLVAQTLGTTPIGLVASANSGMPVSFTADPPATCMVSQATLMLIAAGTCSVTATQQGSFGWSPAAPVTQTFTVSAGTQTITFSSIATQTVGSAPAALLATSSSGLPVSFASASPSVCTVSQATVTLLAAGICSVTATQPGNSSWSPASPVTQTFSIAAGIQIITFSSIATQTVGSAPAALLATSSSGLPVSFASASPSVCTVSQATVTLLAAGICSVTATQPGNSSWSPASPVTQTFSIAAGIQIITFSSIATQTVGSAPAALLATSSSGLPVSFASASPSVCTVSQATVTLLAAGICSVTATQPGNSSWSPASPVTQTFSIAAGIQTITFSSIATQTVGSAPAALLATSSSGLPVSFASASPSVCTVSQATVTLLAAGICSVTATQPGNSSWSPASPVTQTFSIAAGIQTITFSSIATQTVGSAPAALLATSSSGLPVSFASASPSVCTVSQATVTLLATGTCSVTASQAGNSSWSPASPVTQTFAVFGRTTVITLASSHIQPTFGTAVTLTATILPGTLTGLVSFLDGQIQIGSATLVAGSASITIASLKPGSHSLTATYLGDATNAASTSPPISQAVLFSDVPDTAYYFSAVNQLSNLGITAGCGNGQFCPLSLVTRDQIAILIIRAIYGSSDNFTFSPVAYFVDVPPSYWAFKWIQKLYELGITSGCGTSTFCPGNPVTRAQMAIFAIRMRYGVSTVFTDPGIQYFTDVPTSNFAYHWIEKMKTDNITMGCGPGLYCGDNPVIRGDMAIFIMRAGFNQLLPINTPILVKVFPNTLTPGAPAVITVTASHTHFAQGSTTLAPIPGIAIGPITVLSPTSFSVQMESVSAAAHPVSILASTVTPTGTEDAILPNGLSVQ